MQIFCFGTSCNATETVWGTWMSIMCMHRGTNRLFLLVPLCMQVLQSHMCNLGAGEEHLFIVSPLSAYCVCCYHQLASVLTTCASSLDPSVGAHFFSPRGFIDHNSLHSVTQSRDKMTGDAVGCSDCPGVSHCLQQLSRMHRTLVIFVTLILHQSQTSTLGGSALVHQ